MTGRPSEAGPIASSAAIPCRRSLSGAEERTQASGLSLSFGAPSPLGFPPGQLLCCLLESFRVSPFLALLAASTQAPPLMRQLNELQAPRPSCGARTIPSPPHCPGRQADHQLVLRQAPPSLSSLDGHSGEGGEGRGRELGKSLLPVISRAPGPFFSSPGDLGPVRLGSPGRELCIAGHLRLNFLTAVGRGREGSEPLAVFGRDTGAQEHRGIPFPGSAPPGMHSADLPFARCPSGTESCTSAVAKLEHRDSVAHLSERSLVQHRGRHLCPLVCPPRREGVTALRVPKPKTRASVRAATAPLAEHCI